MAALTVTRLIETMTMEQAPDDVKLAVDLIELLEANEVPINTAISALKLVLADYQQKQTNISDNRSSE